MLLCRYTQRKWNDRAVLKNSALAYLTAISDVSRVSRIAHQFQFFHCLYPIMNRIPPSVVCDVRMVLEHRDRTALERLKQIDWAELIEGDLPSKYRDHSDHLIHKRSWKLLWERGTDVELRVYDDGWQLLWYRLTNEDQTHKLVEPRSGGEKASSGEGDLAVAIAGRLHRHFHASLQESLAIHAMRGDTGDVLEREAGARWLMDHYDGLIVGIARKTCGERATPEDLLDIAATVWSSVSTSLVRYDFTRSPFGGWLATIARNTSLNYSQRTIEKRLPPLPDREARKVGQEDPEWTAAEAVSVCDEALRQFCRNDIGIPAHKRIVFGLRQYLEYEQEDIDRVLSTTLSEILIVLEEGYLERIGHSQYAFLHDDYTSYFQPFHSELRYASTAQGPLGASTLDQYMERDAKRVVAHWVNDVRKALRRCLDNKDRRAGGIMGYPRERE